MAETVVLVLTATSVVVARLADGKKSTAKVAEPVPAAPGGAKILSVRPSAERSHHSTQRVHAHHECHSTSGCELKRRGDGQRGGIRSGGAGDATVASGMSAEPGMTFTGTSRDFPPAETVTVVAIGLRWSQDVALLEGDGTIPHPSRPKKRSVQVGSYPGGSCCHCDGIGGRIALVVQGGHEDGLRLPIVYEQKEVGCTSTVATLPRKEPVGSPLQDHSAITRQVLPDRGTNAS